MFHSIAIPNSKPYIHPEGGKRVYSAIHNTCNYNKNALILALKDVYKSTRLSMLSALLLQNTDTMTIKAYEKPTIKCSAFATNKKTRNDDDDKGRINFSVALSPKTTRTRNNKLKQ